MFLEHFFLVIFLSYIHPGFGITTLDDDTYEIFVQMVRGEFTIPVKKRTAQQNAARVRFWHNKDKLSLQGGMLCFEGKSIVMKSSPKGVIKKCFKKSKGSGTRKLYHKLTDSYSGVSERNVQLFVWHWLKEKFLPVAKSCTRSLARVIRSCFPKGCFPKYGFFSLKTSA